MFELFEHSKYMIIYKIVNSWNFGSSPSCSILKICYCSKSNNFRNLIFSRNWNIWKTFGILKIWRFWNFPSRQFSKETSKLNFSLNLPNCKFMEFFKFEVFGIFQIGKLRNFEIFFNLENQFGSKNWQFWNCSSIRYPALLAISTL